MSATLINTSQILNETLALMRTNSIALNAVNRQYDSKFATSGVSGKAGTSLQVRLPIQVGIRTGKKINVQDTVEESRTITCTQQFGVDLPAFTSEQLTMNIDDFSNRYLKPAATRIAGYLDSQICLRGALDFANAVGTPSVTPATALVFLEAAQKLNENNVPPQDRTAIINPAANAKMVDALKALYNPNDLIAGQYKTGILKTQLGLDFGMDQNIASIETGTRAGTTQVKTTLLDGASQVIVKGLTNATDTIKAGEVFTIAGVFAVNPESKVRYGSQQQFVVTEDATAVSNEATVKFAPAVILAGPRQNVSALPAANGNIVFAGTASTVSPANLVMHKDAIALVTADLVVPKGVHDAGRKVLDGVSMRFITDYNSENDEFISRFDVFYGITTLRRELGCKVWG
jgi:hypothetical protein